MCVVSMVGDHYRDRWFPSGPEKGRATPIDPWRGWPDNFTREAPAPTQAEFDKLKAEVEEMKKLLKRAVAYDEANAEPHCENDAKMAALRKVADIVGVKLDDVIMPEASA